MHVCACMAQGLGTDLQLSGEAFGGHIGYWEFLPPPYESLPHACAKASSSSLLPLSVASSDPDDLV